MRWRWFFHCAAVPVVFLLAASPIPVLNIMQFHSPFKTGYDFWTPYWSQYWSEKQPLFSLRYIPANAHGLWAEFALHPPRGYRDSNIFGTGTYFVPAFIALVCVGFFFMRITRYTSAAFLAGLSFLLVILSRNNQIAGVRYYLPLLIILIAVAVVPATWAASRARPTSRRP